MLRRLHLVALAVGFALAAAVGACGSDDSRESGATLTKPPLASRQSTAPITSTTPVTTGPTTTPDTATSTTPTTPQQNGGASTEPPAGAGSPGGAPADCPSALGGFIRDLRASGTDCGVARTVATAWFDAVHEGAAPDGPIEAAGYSCKGSLAGERASVGCSGSRGSVTFTASP